MKKFFAVLFSMTFILAMSVCDTGTNPTAPAKEELGASSNPQPVPEVISEAIIENGGEGINTGYVYTTTTSGDVVWTVDTSKSAPVHMQGIGEHAGELKWLDIDIVFKNPYFLTPEGYAGYYIGLPMNFEVHITNSGNRNYEHLDIAAIQEYYETGVCDRWWYPDPQIVAYSKGEAMPGDSMTWWRDISVGANEEVVLNGTYTAPLQTCAGLDQVHLAIQHTNKGALHAATMYYNPEAAVYCPPPPGK